MVHDATLLAIRDTARSQLSLHLLNALLKVTATNLGLPWLWCTRTEQLLDLFERLTGGLGVGDVRLGGCAETQHAEDDESFPTDVVERWGQEEAESEVEELAGMLATERNVEIGGTGLTQLAMEARPIPKARVSRLQTSEA